MTEQNKEHEEYEKERALCDALLLAFENNIKHDYPIPEGHEVNKLVKQALKKNKFPKLFHETIENLLWANKDEYTRLEYHIYSGKDWFLGSEFFYGFGTLHRWYPGKKEEAEKRVQEYFPKHWVKHLQVIYDYIRPKFKGKIESFKLSQIVDKGDCQ